MRDLFENPCWQAEDLGRPMPDSPHAVSVALPLWNHVIGYEEGDPAVTRTFRSGYPRFFLPPLIGGLFAEAERRLARSGEGATVFPTLPAARRAAEYVLRKTSVAPRIREFRYGTLTVLLFPESVRSTVKEYWRFSGEIVSTRLAEAARLNETQCADMRSAETIKKRLADWHGIGPENIFLFPSGMAGVFAVHRMVCARRPNAQSIQWDFPYVDVLKVQEQFGPGAHFIPSSDEASAAQIRDLAGAQPLSAVFGETPSNPLLRTAPVHLVSEALKKRGVPLVVDDTVATCINIDALRFADVVTTSLTKWFSGAGDVMAGAVILNPNSQHYDDFRTFLDREMAENACFFAGDAAALEGNSRDFSARVGRANLGGLELANFLNSHPKIDQVYYPWPDDPSMEPLRRPQSGGGGLLSFTLRDAAQAPAVYDALRVCKGPSLGTNFTLCCPYTLLAHYQELDWAKQCGVARNLLRVSVGQEDPGRLKDVFAEAFARTG